MKSFETQKGIQGTNAKHRSRHFSPFQRFDEQRKRVELGQLLRQRHFPENESLH